MRHVSFSGGPSLKDLGIDQRGVTSVPRPSSASRTTVAAELHSVRVTGFTVPPGYAVSQENAALYNRAKAIQDAAPGTVWIDAVRAASAEIDFARLTQLNRL